MLDALWFETARAVTSPVFNAAPRYPKAESPTQSSLEAIKNTPIPQATCALTSEHSI
jgi:hypothetical protein